MDLYLKFKDKAQAASVIYVDAKAAEDELQFAYRNTDVVGVIYKPTGKLLEDNMPEMATLPGYHVNIRLRDDEDTEALMPYAIDPLTPSRVWG